MEESIKHKICIIDHLTHNVFIETVNEELLNSKYDGEEENYIKETYGFSDKDLKENVSWEWVKNVYIITPNEPKS